jgi:hypothetical protein
VSGGYPDINHLVTGSRWYTRGHGAERAATLRGLRTGSVSKGRRVYAYAIIETPPGSGSIEDWKLDDFVNAWWCPSVPDDHEAAARRLRTALKAIVDHPCPQGQADCTCGPGETSMRGIARAALEGA